MFFIFKVIFWRTGIDFRPSYFLFTTVKLNDRLGKFWYFECPTPVGERLSTRKSSYCWSRPERYFRCFTGSGTLFVWVVTKVGSNGKNIILSQIHFHLIEGYPIYFKVGKKDSMKFSIYITLWETFTFITRFIIHDHHWSV